MIQLFEKARKWHEPGSEAYGRVLLLQVSTRLPTTCGFLTQTSLSACIKQSRRQIPPQGLHMHPPRTSLPFLPARALLGLYTPLTLRSSPA